MQITLSWDLMVIVFFAVVIAYSFIVGKDESIKIVIASYISILAVQGIGNLLFKAYESAGFITGGPAAEVMSSSANDNNVLAIAKLIIFVVMIIFLALKGGFEMQNSSSLGAIMEPLFTALFGIATAGLLLAALLTFIAARPLLDTTLIGAPLLSPLLTQSTLVQWMVIYQDVWFCLPAVLLLVIGFLNSRGE